MDVPLLVYMDFLAIYVKFQLNKVLFSRARGRIVSMGTQKYDQTIFYILQHITWKIHFKSSREGWASSRRQSKNRRNSVCEHRRGEEMMEINGGGNVADLNDPCARRLEAILAGFGRQVRLQDSRDMKPTLISSYFASWLLYLLSI